MKVVGLCGVPGTGKTTVMREVIKNITMRECRYGKALDYLSCDGIDVLGKYDGGMFDGTDRLSMAVINDVEKFLTDSQYQSVAVLFEGDRLWCPRFVNFVVNEVQAEFLFLYLLIDTPSLVRRHTERAAAGHPQDSKFIVSRHTKYNNLMRQYPFFQKRTNNNHGDLIKIVDEINLFLET